MLEILEWTRRKVIIKIYYVDDPQSFLGKHSICPRLRNWNSFG